MPRPGEPLVLSVLGWAGREIEAALDRTRRQINAALFNNTPTADPLLFGESPEGVVIGTLGAADAENDPVSYQVVTAPNTAPSQSTPTVPSPTPPPTRWPPTAAPTLASTDHRHRVPPSPVPRQRQHHRSRHRDGGPRRGDERRRPTVAAATRPDGKRVYIVDALTNSVKIEMLPPTPRSAPSASEPPLQHRHQPRQRARHFVNATATPSPSSTPPP